MVVGLDSPQLFLRMARGGGNLAPERQCRRDFTVGVRADVSTTRLAPYKSIVGYPHQRKVGDLASCFGQ